MNIGDYMELIEIYIEENYNERLDSFLTKKLDNVSRNYISKLIKDGSIIINGKRSKARYIVKKGDLISIKLPKPKELEVLGENIPLNIVYEDRDILIVNKPQGIVTHPAPGNTTGTLVNGLIYYDETISEVGDIARPGIVHRLDKNTSGLLIVAKNQESYKSLVEDFKTRKIKRKYMALVYGKFSLKEGTINAPIGRHPVDRKRMAVVYENSKEAITDYKVLEEFKDYSLLEIHLQTGRTHQIRVHMAYLKHPIVGDGIYSRRKNEFKIHNQLLHAKSLGFYHPRTKEYMEIESDLPEEFSNIVELLRKRNR